MQEAENGKRKINYTLMILLVVIVILLLVCLGYKHRVSTLEAERTANMETIENQAAELLKLQEENADLVALREELTDKVTILSDTINLKVEAEEEQEQVRAQAHMPVGFPMSSSASLEESDGEDPMVKLNGTVGNSIIASADGTVVSITTDTSYLHCIKIDHGNGYNSIYRNDGDVMIKEGDEVVRGAILYVIGEDNTELGYQIMYADKYIDPMDLISIDG